MRTNTAIRSKIQKDIAQSEEGTFFFPNDFLRYGSSTGVNMALSRLAMEGIIERIAHGIYRKPKNHPLFGKSTPSLEEIAEAVAEKEKIQIRPTGAFALNKMGLSTQVPTNVVYLTNGNSRKLKIRDGELIFKKTTPKAFAVKNDAVYLIIQALSTLGPDQVNDKTIAQVSKILMKENFEEAGEDAKLAPAWIARIIYEIITNPVDNGRMAAAK